ncbi:GTP cyclohydrolase II RibA [Microvirga antarctica]|uniref:GTP cyclohydrolase II RibA n=1 Tax=Microvirga antarctica TaxID=2819233 RepID=UPI001B311DBD|nr:GTP cyclohydrolase II RibA [Microvirga antarctica]
MSTVPTGLRLIEDHAFAAAERAISEFRSARPVVLMGAGEALVAVGVEGVEADLASRLDRLSDGAARLILPPARLRRLGLERTGSGIIALPSIDLERVETLALKLDARIDAPVGPPTPLDEAALELAHLALVFPAVIAVSIDPSVAFDLGAVVVDADDIVSFKRRKIDDLRIVSRAPVPLDGALDTEFVIFRGGEGLRDQVAIVIGHPDLAGIVDVRLHSACLTGDLFGSLKCDCGDQLRDTVARMAQGEGGILLYLDQEGRGNGIANKMKAYKLQSQGYDTYDADEVLGFDLDQRRFEFAAAMLKQLGVSSVRLITNNPVKIAALRDAGLEVQEQRVLGRATAENVRYLASKRDRAGHKIDFDVLAAFAAPND